MIDLKRYESLKKEVDRCRREHDRAEGAHGQLLARLKAEHGCENLEQAKKKLAELKKERDDLAERFNEKLREFEDDYGEDLK